jgi:hypothetical protein
MGRRARRYAEREWSAEATAARYLDELVEITSNPAGGRR